MDKGIQNIRPDDLTVVRAGFQATAATEKTNILQANLVDTAKEKTAEIPVDAEESAALKSAAKSQSLTQRAPTIQRPTAAEAKPAVLRPVKEVKDSAEKFSRQNPELKASVLILLRDRMKGKTKEEILSILRDFYHDVSVADEALDFLIENADTPEEKTILQEAKADFHQSFEREIKAGRNIMEVAAKAAGKTLGPAGTLRDLYRDFLFTPRDSKALSQELYSKYPDLKDREKVCKFILHAAAADLHKGPSIPAPELMDHVRLIRDIQAHIGVARVCEKLIKLLEKEYEHLNHPHFAPAA